VTLPPWAPRRRRRARLLAELRDARSATPADCPGAAVLAPALQRRARPLPDGRLLLFMLPSLWLDWMQARHGEDSPFLALADRGARSAARRRRPALARRGGRRRPDSVRLSGILKWTITAYPSLLEPIARARRGGARLARHRPVARGRRAARRSPPPSCGAMWQTAAAQSARRGLGADDVVLIALGHSRQLIATFPRRHGARRRAEPRRAGDARASTRRSTPGASAAWRARRRPPP
jgi:hypothetical protein